MSLRPGETVHYVALLAEDGTILITVPMDNPPTVPKHDSIVGAKVDVKINVELELKSSGKR